MNNAFRDGMRVRTVKGLKIKGELFQGKTGTVVRVLMRSPHEAWVKMDEELPDGLRSFEDDQRKNHILLDIEDVEEVIPKKEKS